MAERLECCTCNPEASRVGPALTASLICTLVNSKKVCFLPFGILNLVMFHLNLTIIKYLILWNLISPAIRKDIISSTAESTSPTLSSFHFNNIL